VTRLCHPWFRSDPARVSGGCAGRTILDASPCTGSPDQLYALPIVAAAVFV
jgi:hypothetical protein